MTKTVFLNFNYIYNLIVKNQRYYFYTGLVTLIISFALLYTTKIKFDGEISFRIHNEFDISINEKIDIALNITDPNKSRDIIILKNELILALNEPETFKSIGYLDPPTFLDIPSSQFVKKDIGDISIETISIKLSDMGSKEMVSNTSSKFVERVNNSIIESSKKKIDRLILAHKASLYEKSNRYNDELKKIDLDLRSSKVKMINILDEAIVILKHFKFSGEKITDDNAKQFQQIYTPSMAFPDFTLDSFKLYYEEGNEVVLKRLELTKAINIDQIKELNSVYVQFIDRSNKVKLAINNLKYFEDKINSEQFYSAPFSKDQIDIRIKETKKFGSFDLNIWQLILTSIVVTALLGTLIAVLSKGITLNVTE